MKQKRRIAKKKNPKKKSKTTTFRSKLKVLVHSNHSRMVTGFGKNAKNLLLALHEDPDIEVIEAANGVNYGANLLTPWKSYGTGLTDKNKLEAIKNDSLKQRCASYGGYTIDEIIEGLQARYLSRY